MEREHRPRSAAFCPALSTDLHATPCDIVDVGLVPTPLLYFSLFHLNTDSGCMITASHKPAEYNGIKLCSAGRRSVESGTWVRRATCFLLENLVARLQFVELDSEPLLDGLTRA